jgi:predicted site-specific integrase-resolvase
VSFHKQKADLACQLQLQIQIQTLQDRYPGYKVYQEVCSGLKYTHKEESQARLLVAAQEGVVAEFVVSHQDRLARFGTELCEWIFRKAGVSVVFLDDHVLSQEQEIVEDLLAIVHVFSCR